MSLESTETNYKSRYGIDKLQDHNYFSWAYACKLLLKERKVWKVVDGTEKRPVLPRSTQDTVDVRRGEVVTQSHVDECSVRNWLQKSARNERTIQIRAIDP